MKTLLLYCGILLIPILAHAQESRIELRTFQSTMLGIPKSYNIYLPSDYDKTTERYPVIYLFRGHEREWANPVEDDSRQGRTVKDDADAVIASGLMGRVILVMPGMSSSDDAVPACAVNMVAPNLATTKDGIGTGRFEDYLVKELIPYIDSTCRTIPSRWYRAVDGFSLGGYTSMMLATKHPELWTSVGSFDGTLMWLDFTNPTTPGTLNDLWVTNSMFDPMFGKPRNMTVMTSYNEADLIKNASADVASALRQMQFLLHSTPQGNDDRTRHVIGLLAEKGIPNGFSVVPITPNAQHNWYYADMHAMQTFPKHWAKFQTPSASLYSPLAGPAPGQSVSGIVPLAWLRGTTRPAVTLLMASRDAGATWETLVMSKTNDSTFQWDTRLMPDGTRYMLRLLVMADSSLGLSQTAGVFTVNNPGNAAPDLALTAPAFGDTVSNQTAIRWISADAEGDSVRISIDFSADNGTTWETLASSIANTGSFLWNTTVVANSQQCLIRVRATDGLATTEKISSMFTVKNVRYGVSATIIHQSGAGDGTVRIISANPPSWFGNSYRLTFNDSSAGGTTYSVEDHGVRVVDNARLVSGVEGPLFNGYRLIITNYSVPKPSPDSTIWIKGVSTLEGAVSLPDVLLGTGTLKGVPYPADYVITITSGIADTSSTFLDSPALPMKFTVRNRTENRKAEVLFNDNDNDAMLSRNDELYFIEKNAAGGKELTWQIVFTGNDRVVNPAVGDQFLVKILKPFTSRDLITITPIVCDVPKAQAVPDRCSLEQNFPNPFNPTTTIRFALAHRTAVSLRVYDVLGREIAVLVNGMIEPGAHAVEWNAVQCASGMYFYRLDAGGFSQTRKLVLMR